MEPMKVSFPGGKRVDASFAGFLIKTDQSEKFGGDASEPEPYSLFMASLATCAGVYVLGFCQKRDISTEGLSLEQSWERDKDGKMTALTINIKVPPSFPEKYHSALIRTANLCAVKKTIENPPEFIVQTVVTEE
jgi:putative redox protein